jgi:hypothetical protein
MNLVFTENAVVVIAGLPGAGKTTLIRRAVDRSVAHVVDTEDRRDQLPVQVPSSVLHAEHLLRIVVATLRRPAVVVHSRGTNPGQRRLVVTLAALRRREAHLILLDADPAAAEEGQRARGRTLARWRMEREARRWQRVVSSARAGDRLRGEGWTSIQVLDRAEASDVDAIVFQAGARSRARARATF